MAGAARDVAGHAMGVVNNVAARGGVGQVIDVFAEVGAIGGDDPLATFRAIRDRFLDATDRPGALQTVITSSVGEVTLDQYIGMMCADTLVHTWDLARAAGVDDLLDPGAVRWVHAELARATRRASASPAGTTTRSPSTAAPPTSRPA